MLLMNDKCLFAYFFIFPFFDAQTSQVLIITVKQDNVIHIL